MLNLFLTEPSATTAAADTATEAATPGLGDLFGMLFPIILIFIVFYFFLIRPEKKRKKEIDSMRSSLKVGDKVTTIGGILGTITYINDDEDIVAIKTGVDNVEIRFARWAIGAKQAEEIVEEKAE